MAVRQKGYVSSGIWNGEIILNWLKASNGWPQVIEYMGIFPEGGGTILINDTVVVKLSDP